MKKLPWFLYPFLSCLLIAQDPLWTIYITNDACSDYTWGFDEAKTRKAYADVVRAHLDEMTRTDNQKPANQDRYNMSVAQEADAFLEYYPERKAELASRIKEGRIWISPVYNNALWGFQSTEGMLRAFYPARRMQVRWGFPFDIVEHMEQPGLPWGAASILAGSGIRWVSMPYYDFDSTFSGLTNPALFNWEGPDGQKVGVRMDKFASDAAHYTEGAYLLEDTKRISGEWLPHYEKLGSYPGRALLASGTHGDNNPTNGARTRGFADGIISYNSQTEPQARLFNATLPMFFRAVDDTHAKLPELRGDFGDSWDVWPVTLARYAAASRIHEHEFLSAEALLSQASNADATRDERQRAEWNWIMLADHAWNGTDDTNKRVNAELRRKWSEDFGQTAEHLTAEGWQAVGLKHDATHITLFNGLSVARADLVRVEVSGNIKGVLYRGKPLHAQVEKANGRDVLYFVSPTLAGFEFAELELTEKASGREGTLHAGDTYLENSRFKLIVDAATGGIGSLIDRASGQELVVPGKGRSIGQTVFFNGTEHVMSKAVSQVDVIGPVFARLKVRGFIDGIEVTNLLTIYSELDRIDLDVRVHKPVSTEEQRLTQEFPVARAGDIERLETVGAVIRPVRQPEGDLLPGADTRRFAVQGFVDSSSSSSGFTVAPLEAFTLRKDVGDITFEALGNDHDYKEMSHDQNGETEFRFRYALHPHNTPYANAAVVAWSRSVANPLLVGEGRLARTADYEVTVDGRRAMATTFKPGEDAGRLLRIWETAGRSGPLLVDVRGFRQAVLTDLLERPLHPLAITNGQMAIDLKANGFAAVQLIQ